MKKYVFVKASLSYRFRMRENKKVVLTGKRQGWGLHKIFISRTIFTTWFCPILKKVEISKNMQPEHQKTWFLKREKWHQSFVDYNLNREIPEKWTSKTRFRDFYGIRGGGFWHSQNWIKRSSKIWGVSETFWRKTWGRVCSRCAYEWFLRL